MLMAYHPARVGSKENWQAPCYELTVYIKFTAFANVSLFILWSATLFCSRTPGHLNSEQQQQPQQQATSSLPSLLTNQQLPTPDAATHLATPENQKRLAQLTLRTFTVQIETGAESPLDQCIICLNGSYSSGEVVRELHCHHTYHSSCFASWIYKGGKACAMRCDPFPASLNADTVHVRPAYPTGPRFPAVEALERHYRATVAVSAEVVEVLV